jgi:glycine cleavage system transcriptional repressor
VARFALSAIGRDRPGIVAGVSGALLQHGANIEDSRMAILGGHFAMVLIVALPPGTEPSALEASLAEPARALDLTVSVRPVADVRAGQGAGSPFVVSVYGADHPGIVSRVSGVLADARVNISDLATHVVEGDPPVYVMVLEVTLPEGADPAAVEGALTALAAELAVDVSMHPMEPETL